ncbi:hypothetical protein HPB50_021577 [Hyalomma asiaticum]|uniref:Uncharacterized protein n=1 Tax=Hyalomma asiaticum TaxID=266040 RepID=A0ACB7SYI0_HYAAI|nr:hypothetical protein HPB50_021577 [Hyalomma asiaticum]
MPQPHTLIQIARKAPEEKHEKCLLDGVDALMKAGGTATTRSGKDPLGKVVDYFQRNKLCLLLSDKEGGSVVMEQGDYNTRATEAIRKNFEALRPSHTKVKCKMAALCRDLELSSCQRSKAAFSRRGCIPGVLLACVEGTLVAIEKPQGLSLGDRESYMTRRGYYALNVMVLTPSPLSRPMNPLCEQLASQLELGDYVLGDSGYLLETWLLTPIPGNLAPGTPECEYNKEHTSMRNVVGRCIGVPKRRFRCLQRYRALLYKPDRAAGIVSACAALHNITLEAGEPVFAEDSDGGAMPPAPV